jgi:signal transduction histidine kinase/CheY-like chemotaxis protein
MEGEHQSCSGLGPATLAGALFHESPDALLVIDPISERVLDTNVMAERLSEFSRDELARLTLRSLVRHKQEWQDWLVPGAGTALAESEPFLLRTGQPDRWVPVSLTISRLALEGGQGPWLLCRLRDRREQVEMQRRLQRAEAEVRRLVGWASDGLYTGRIEADGRWRYRCLSPGFERLMARPLALLLQEPQAREQAVHPDDLPRWQDFVARLLAGQPAQIDYRLRRPDGSSAVVHETAVASREEGGLLVQGAITDSGTSGALGHAARLDGVARLAGVVAHDLNNILTGILGNVGLLRLVPPADEMTAASLTHLETATQRAVDLSRQLAAVAGKAAGQAGVTDLQALVQRRVGSLQAGLAQHQQLRLSLAADLPPVAADEPTVAVLLEQLLNNAREALGDRPGEIEVRTSLGQAPLARPGAPALRYPETGPDAPLVCLEVRDSGPGLSAEARARLFEPFFSTHERRGLGLATVLGIVRGLHGAIEVFSLLGQGSTFRVLLAAATVPAPSRSTAPAAPAPASWRGEGVVLLADDEWAVLDVVNRLLTSLGCRVITARSGEELLECYRNHASEVRVVLVDLVMPRLSGEKVLLELRRLAPQLPVLVMSGHAEQDVVPRLAPLGLTGYLQKPFRLPALLEAVRPYLAVSAPVQAP